MNPPLTHPLLLCAATSPLPPGRGLMTPPECLVIQQVANTVLTSVLHLIRQMASRDRTISVRLFAHDGDVNRALESLAAGRSPGC